MILKCKTEIVSETRKMIEKGLEEYKPPEDIFGKDIQTIEEADLSESLNSSQSVALDADEVNYPEPRLTTESMVIDLHYA